MATAQDGPALPADGATPPWQVAVRGHDGAVQLWLRVQPAAQRSQFLGAHGDRLRVALRAPPVDGKANAALLELTAAVLGVPRSAVQLAAGLASRDKRVDVTATRATVLAALRAVL